MKRRIPLVTGVAGESYETLYAVHRFREAGDTVEIAAPSRRRLHPVMHDFEPGWDTYIERPGYGVDATLAFADVRVKDSELPQHLFVMKAKCMAFSLTRHAFKLPAMPSSASPHSCAPPFRPMSITYEL